MRGPLTGAPQPFYGGTKRLALLEAGFGGLVFIVLDVCLYMCMLISVCVCVMLLLVFLCFPWFLFKAEFRGLVCMHVDMCCLLVCWCMFMAACWLYLVSF